MEPTALVREFLMSYQQALATNDLETIGRLYAEHFMFADPHGVRPVERTAFMAVMPKREQFFANLGLKKTDLGTIEEKSLSNGYSLVHATWTMHFVKGDKKAESVNESTYILREQEGQLQIIFQLDHQDLTECARQLGLLEGCETLG